MLVHQHMVFTLRLCIFTFWVSSLQLSVNMQWCVAGALNKVAVMSCDYILPPAMVDPSNLSSLHGLLTAVLPTWYHDHHALRERTRKATARMSEGGAIYCLPKKPPRVLPTVAINFGLRDSKVMKNKSQWIRQIRTLYADIIHQSSQPLPADHEYIEQLQHEGLNKVCTMYLASIPTQTPNGLGCPFLLLACKVIF